jgi:YHS domain-containing protein
MTRLKHLVWVISALSIALSVALVARAAAESQKSPVAAVNATERVGVKGYDPVAYFTIGRPTPGLPQYAYQWIGVTYRFASADDREKFKADPPKYLPQYGGYCAYAMSIDRIADIDPSRWAVVNNKLYLNNNYLSFHLWSLNKRGNIASADEYWPLYPKKAVGE